MNQTLWQELLAAFRAGEIDIEAFIAKITSIIDADAEGLGGLIGNLVSTDANTLVTDFGPDLQAIVTNIQNTTTGLSDITFGPLFLAAALPVAEKEGLKILAEDWVIIKAYFAANNKITATPANNGIVS